MIHPPSKLRGATTGHIWPNAIHENSHERAINDPTVPQLWCYTDQLSYTPNEVIGFHISTTAQHVHLTLIRDGGQSEIVHRYDFAGEFHNTSEQCSVTGCGWPVGYSLKIPADWRSGGYRIHVQAQMKDGTTLTHDSWFALRAAPSQAVGDILQIAATSTWLAYNDWGGSNHYEGICGPQRNQSAPSVSLNRPWARGFCHLPIGAPRTVLNFNPAPGAMPRYPHMEWAYANGYSKKYASTGWATYDRHFSVWAEQNGYRVDMATQHDLHLISNLLDRYSCAVIVGHDEYWSWEMREAIDRFVERGGHLVRLGGNFLLQVRLEENGRRQICYQGRATDLYPGDPYIGTEKAHLQTGYWDDPAIGWPSVKTMGLSGLRGIYANFGMCTPRGSRGFTVYRPEHWVFAGTDLQYGDLLGHEARIFGYEVDGLDYTFRYGLPFPSGEDPVPEGLEILAMSVATNVEEARGFDLSNIFLGDESANTAKLYYGSDDALDLAKTRYGSGMIAAFPRGKGHVFNAATCEWVHGLIQRDHAVETITRNVLNRGRHR